MSDLKRGIVLDEGSFVRKYAGKVYEKKKGLKGRS